MSEIYKGEPINGNFENKHIVSIEQFERDDIDQLFEESDATRRVVESEDGTNLLYRKELANLFYEHHHLLRRLCIGMAVMSFR